MDKSVHNGGAVALQVISPMAGAFWKASFPMVVTELPMVTLDNAEQPLKAMLPISVTESGMSILVRDAQLRNVPAPIDAMDLPRVALVNDVQPENAPTPMLVTASGITMPDNAVHCAKAEEPIAVTALPRVTLVRLVQPSNAT